MEQQFGKPQSGALPSTAPLRRNRAALRAAGYLARAAEQEFVAEQERGATLRAERAQYSELTTVLSELDTVKAAHTVALYAEVDWTRVVREFERALPGEGSRLTELNLAQRLSPGVGSGGYTDSSDENPLSTLSPLYLEYRFESDTEQAGSQLLDRLVTEMTGYEWATQTTAQRRGENDYAFAGWIRLGMPAIGTKRAESLDEDTLAALHEAFANAAIDRNASSRGAN